MPARPDELGTDCVRADIARHHWYWVESWASQLDTSLTSHAMSLEAIDAALVEGVPALLELELAIPNAPVVPAFYRGVLASGRRVVPEARRLHRAIRETHAELGRLRARHVGHARRLLDRVERCCPAPPPPLPAPRAPYDP